MTDLDEPLRAPGKRALIAERRARQEAEVLAERLSARIQELEGQLAALRARSAQV